MWRLDGEVPGEWDEHQKIGWCIEDTSRQQRPETDKRKRERYIYREREREREREWERARERAREREWVSERGPERERGERAREKEKERARESEREREREKEGERDNLLCYITNNNMFSLALLLIRLLLKTNCERLLYNSAICLKNLRWLTLDWCEWVDQRREMQFNFF